MSQWVKVRAEDGQELSAYVAEPAGSPKGAFVLVQEIFGVNGHIRSIADLYATYGYLCIAPSLFDRFEPGVQLAYEGPDLQKAFALYNRLDPSKALLDVAAAAFYVQEEGRGIGVLGFCYGGFMAWISATRGGQVAFQPRCAIGYYAGGIGTIASEMPTCPVMLHFGEADTHIGSDQVQAVRDAHPEVQIFTYPGAGHAFNRNVDVTAYVPTAAALAQERTLSFLADCIQ